MRELSSDVAINGLKVAKRYGDILVKRIDTNKDDDLMNDEAISQAAKVGTVINIHNKPANDAMAIASRQQSEPESTEITITGGMDMLPVPYDHPPRNRSEEDI
jgi:ribosomal 30S subunit maturation factor RimM